MCVLLKHYGADVYGYALNPPTEPSLYDIVGVDKMVTSEIGDIRDWEHLSSFYKKVRPDFVIHMAAQPLVRLGYDEPRMTYESNVMGTINILECVRIYGCRSFLNVTTDKVYRNLENGRKYIETDELDGFDPYSNSKSCSELVTATYRRSFPRIDCAISTARAGNVIGGGDFARDRIVPDCVRAAVSHGKIILRNPGSVRPYQHVLEPLFGYLSILVAQYEERSKAGSYNIAPKDGWNCTTGMIADLFCGAWRNDLLWGHVDDDGPHEANLLMLDGSKINAVMGFKSKWSVDVAIGKVVDWTKVWHDKGDVYSEMINEILEYAKEGFSDV